MAFQKLDHEPSRGGEPARGIPSRPVLVGPSRPVALPSRTLGNEETAVLAALLDELPSPAYVIWEDASIHVANRAGAEASARAPAETSLRLRASLQGRDRSYRVTRIAVPGAPRHYLAIHAGGPTDVTARVRIAADVLGATPRQAEVLSLLVLGRANKAIAIALGCAESTVEIHVGDLLHKSGCESRCELASRFWSGPMRRKERAGSPPRRGAA
jgi:DNA-binding CsgD family transcriptional regulator